MLKAVLIPLNSFTNKAHTESNDLHILNQTQTIVSGCINSRRYSTRALPNDELRTLKRM